MLHDLVATTWAGRVETNRVKTDTLYIYPQAVHVAFRRHKLVIFQSPAFSFQPILARKGLQLL